MGLLSFTERPISCTNLVMIFRRRSWLSNFSGICSSFPARSTNMVSYPLIMTSVILLSAMIFPKIPSPLMDSKTLSARLLRVRKDREE